jgi:hypothetical protein
MSQRFPDCLIKVAAEKLDVEPRVVKAIVQVESSGNPFIGTGTKSPRGLDLSGRPVIQFEGHVFWRSLLDLNNPKQDPLKLLHDPETAKIVDITGKPIGELLSEILYPKLDMKYMKAPKFEWDQLIAARAINERLANQATSWGTFQIMGFNYKYAGCTNVDGFVSKSYFLEGQLDLFLTFAANYPGVLKAMKAKDFKTFALIYNGKGAAKNGYANRMIDEYRRAKI